MNSGGITQLIGAFVGVLFTVFYSIGHFVVNGGEYVSHYVTNNSFVEKHLEELGSGFGNTFAISTSSITFAVQLPLSPADARDITPPTNSVTPHTTKDPLQKKTSAPIISTSTRASQTPSPTKLPPPAVTVTQPVTQDASGSATPFNTILNSTEDAVVNILCTSQSGNLITINTGSGVIIDPRGIILTNAHVAQDLLFTNVSQPPIKDCTVRQGHIISSLYKVSVLYIPLSWAQANKGLDENQTPEGTGEGDYALLAITKSATGDSMPSSFPYISPVTTYRDPTNENVLAIGYPAENIKGSLQAGVPEKYAATNIKTTFTLSESTADIFQTSPNIVAERGSSGGAIIDKNGGLLGLIVSVQNPSVTDGSEGLEAISVPYIFKNFSANGISVSTLAANPTAAAQNFAPTGVTIRNLVQ